jgi:hypothetical protein
VKKTAADRPGNKLLEELAGSVELNLPVRQLQQWPAVFALPRQSRWKATLVEIQGLLPEPSLLLV